MLNVTGNAGREVECSDRGEEVNVTMEWLRAKLSFEVLRSALLCVRGSKKAWYKNEEVKISQDFELSFVESGLTM